MSETSTDPRWQLGRRSWAVTAGLIFAIGLTATVSRTIWKYQTPGPFDETHQGMCDFHNGLYFPIDAFRKGISPYSHDYNNAYPVARQIPFYSPAILVAHYPFAVVPLHVGEVAYFMLMVGVLVAIAWFIASITLPKVRLDLVFAICAAIVLSRGGHITLFNGYFTLQLVLASFLAIHWADKRPVWSAIALAFVATKPTFILPLGMLMLARGNVKALVIGAVLSLATTGASMAWLAAHYGDESTSGWTVLLGHVQETQEIHRSMMDESPATSWTRLDLLAVVAKWTVWDPAEAVHMVAMVILLLPAMVILNLRRLRNEDDGVAGVTGAIILLFTLTSLYHQSYDTLLFFAPLVGAALMSTDDWKRMTPSVRYSIVICMLVPLFNYLSTRMLLHRVNVGETMEKLLTSLSGVAIATAAIIILVYEVRRIRGPQREPLAP